MSKHYDIFTIQQYLAGELSREKMHQLEHDALQDPMLQDAIDGFESSRVIDFKELSLLQQRIQKRIIQQHAERNHFYFGRQRLAIASVAGVLFILACLLFWMIYFPTKETNQQSLQEVNINVGSLMNVSLLEGDLEPEIGWSDYNHYLRINTPEILRGERIEISFGVLNQRPISVKVVTSSVSNEHTQTIVKLIEDGPKWKGTKGILVMQF
jgi:hypothetical protein